MALAVGIVGLPNVGKSTLFNALSDAGAESANYPFCTIEPNHGVVSVPDPRLDELVAIIKPKSIVPTTVEFNTVLEFEDPSALLPGKCDVQSDSRTALMLPENVDEYPVLMRFVGAGFSGEGSA